MVRGAQRAVLGRSLGRRQPSFDAAMETQQPEVDEPEGRLGDIELDGPLQAVEADVQLTGCGRSFDLWLQN